MTYESFGGLADLMQWIVKKMMAKKLVRGVGDWAKDLKLGAESLTREEDGARESGLKKNEHGKWTLIASGKKDMPTA